MNDLKGAYSECFDLDDLKFENFTTMYKKNIREIVEYVDENMGKNFYYDDDAPFVLRYLMGVTKQKVGVGCFVGFSDDVETNQGIDVAVRDITESVSYPFEIKKNGNYEVFSFIFDEYILENILGLTKNGVETKLKDVSNEKQEHYLKLFGG